MPIASPEIYSQMLDRAKKGALHIQQSTFHHHQRLLLRFRGFAEANSDGIIQFSWGGAEFASGSTVKKMVDGAVALAEFAHIVAKITTFRLRYTLITVRLRSWMDLCARSLILGRNV